jgi:hypothetical protein
MSAVTVRAPLPHYGEALAYWDELTLQCRRHVKAINAVIGDNQRSETESVQWQPGSLSVAMFRDSYPSTEIKLNLMFEHWGPKICGSIRGHQEKDLRFYPEEFEFGVCCDQDDNTVAVTSEGRGLSPHELAKYVAQNFRRCFPGVTLPSPETPLE